MADEIQTTVLPDRHPDDAPVGWIPPERYELAQQKIRDLRRLLREHGISMKGASA